MSDLDNSQDQILDELRLIRKTLDFFKEKFVATRQEPSDSFWGCTKYPECKGTRNNDGSTKPPF